MLSEREQALKRFVDHVKSQAKRNLTMQRKNASKKLYNSIDSEYKVMKNSIRVSFSMEDYGYYQDKGVSGTERKFDTPFKYTTKRPPASAFSKWAVIRGIAPRNDKGQFENRKSLQFALANTIYKRGIKPSLFFTKPFEKAFKNLPGEMVESFGLDAVSLFDTIMKENFKK